MLKPLKFTHFNVIIENYYINLMVRKYSDLQRKVLLFYRDYLKFANTKPEVNKILCNDVM